ncbi:MAG TPA: 2-isopropylmalate synthase, partial [Thermoleophilaceae bacterium]
MDRTEQNRVRIFDTTLRDGEQSPGISLNKQEKLEIAHQLARLGVDIIEAGFPISSPGDFEAVQAIAREVHGPVICGLARANAQDVDAAWNAVKESERPRIHTFISTSDIHIEHQLQSTREDVKGQARAAVAQAREHCEDVEFSPMDATRADLEFTAEVLQIALDEGATTINVPDTVGYSMPEEYAAMWRELYRLVPGLADVTTSVHCHDDLGLAVANSFAGVLAGCRQVECAINGIGERAGNASLEEIVMLLRVREAGHGLWSGVDTREIARTSRMVSRLTGYQVQPNKAIVGRNAFAHESGIHQDGVLKERTTYEIMDATTIGLETNSLVLGKHSGRHALRNALEELGFQVDGAALNTAFKRFKELADKKKKVTALDLEAIVSDEMKQAPAAYELVSFDIEASSTRSPLARVSVRMPDGEVESGSFTGDGPVDAFFSALNAATGHEARLREYHVSAVTGGRDALGEVTVLLELGGQISSGV